jgi:tRNA dimethylallyltransferase
MMSAGFLAEVENLRARPDIDKCGTAMRAVGYRQLSVYLTGEVDREEAVRRGIAASRQLAKRQLTWIRADSGWRLWDPFDAAQRERWVDESTFVCKAAG